MADQVQQRPGKLPGTFMAFVAKYPELGRAHEQIARTVETAGPLGKKELALAKIGIALGAGLESALKSHVRRARQAGATEEEVEQVILLGMNTVGFPKTVAAWSWAREQFARDSAAGDGGGGDSPKEGTGNLL